jgi:hypothetical protein
MYFEIVAGVVYGKTRTISDDVRFIGVLWLFDNKFGWEIG